MRDERPYEVIEVEGGVPVKAWVRGVSLEEAAARQLRNVARLPCVRGWVAAMPDVHWGSARPWGASSRPWGRSSRPRSASTSAAAWQPSGPR